MTLSASGQPWWASAVVYQIYPRSFADGNGDGVGDLIGVRQHLHHIVELGVDALWLSPFYRSPMADGGYDVSDPCDVDPMFGTLADFDALLAEAHRHRLRVTIDLVPNHFSDQHPWFQAALASGPGSAQRARFVFRPGRGTHGELPPNNWPSAFGGPSWTRVPDGEWYLHLFAPEQPDLDWTNPEIADEFERIMRFWLDRGVDGFRIDVANGMAKEPGLPDLPLTVLATAGTGMPSAEDLRWDRDEVHAHLRRFRRVLDSYPAVGADGGHRDARMAVGEAWVADAERLAHYVRPDELNLTFNFGLAEADWGAPAYRSAIESALIATAEVGGVCTWALANHDIDRIVTRYGGGATGLARARAAALVQLSLPGSAYLYNGDELGLPNVDLPDEALQDPTWERSGHLLRGRDGERVPLPWSGDAPPYGFTAGADTWLPMPAGWAELTIAVQQDDSASTLSLYRHALSLRHARADLTAAPLTWTSAPDSADVLSYRRGAVTIVLNTGVKAVPLPRGDVLVSSGPLADQALPTDTAVWVHTG